MFALPHRGHHSTGVESFVRRRYPKPARKALRQELTVQQRKQFDATWNGRRMPLEDDFLLWDELAKDGGQPLTEM